MSRRVYLDASALVKLVLPETESDALLSYLGADATPVSSVVAEVEVARAARFAGARSRVAKRVEAVIESCELVELDAATRAVAATADPPGLRSLDAIHLASALAVREVLDAFVTYDRRLADAAHAAGLAVVSPGG